MREQGGAYVEIKGKAEAGKGGKRGKRGKGGKGGKEGKEMGGTCCCS
jgi:hypothetical protein